VEETIVADVQIVRLICI